MNWTQARMIMVINLFLFWFVISSCVMQVDVITGFIVLFIPSIIFGLGVIIFSLIDLYNELGKW